MTSATASCSLLFIWSLSFVCLNQRDQTDQMNQINPRSSRLSRPSRVSAASVFLVRSAVIVEYDSSASTQVLVPPDHFGRLRA
jgi:hypothetical protein